MRRTHLTAGIASRPGGAATEPGDGERTERRATPFQRSIMEAIAQRQSQGLPHTVTARTTIEFASPEQAGLTFGGACLYQVSLTAMDDDQGEGQDQVTVVVSGAGAPVRLEGYWQHQLSRVGATDFDDAALECLLRVVDYVSGIFGETRDVSSFAAAREVVFMQQNGGSALDQLDRELLVAWLNYASGAFAYDELVDMNGDRVSDTPFAEALAAVEAARSDPAQTEQAIRTVTRILHGVSVAGTGRGEPSPQVKRQ